MPQRAINLGVELVQTDQVTRCAGRGRTLLPSNAAPNKLCRRLQGQATGRLTGKGPKCTDAPAARSRQLHNPMTPPQTTEGRLHSHINNANPCALPKLDLVVGNGDWHGVPHLAVQHLGSRVTGGMYTVWLCWYSSGSSVQHYDNAVGQA